MKKNKIEYFFTNSMETQGASPRLASPDELWEEIGIHRSLASFWFNFVLFLIAAVPALLFNGWLLPNYILPYPEALGFRTLTIGYFGLFFSIMDFATKPAAERFISQYAEIDPPKALRYIQFFIWFQMFTGIIQITAITVFCFTYIIHTDLNYALWFFLIYSLTQYPGMLGAFNSTLRGYQRFDKANIVDIVQTVVVEMITQITFIILGRKWGAANPSVGELMGATIGFIIGKYIDDFIAMGISMHFTKQLLKKYNIPLVMTFKPEFTMEEVRESLLYGIKLLGAQVIATLADYLTLLMMLAWVPNYISIIAYLEIARTLADVVNGINYNFSSIISESYNNGRKRLAQYAVSEYFHHWFYMAFFMAITISMLLPTALRALGGAYAAAAWVVPYYVIPRIMVKPAVMGAEVLQACHLPEYRSVGIFTEKSVKMLTIFLILSPHGFFHSPDLNTLIILYVMHDIPAYIAITYVEFHFVSKKAFKFKLNLWPTFGAGLLASLPLVGIYRILRVSLQGYLESENMGLVLGITIGTIILGLFALPFITFFLYGYFGGWTENSIHDFEKMVPLTGPSKPFVKAFYLTTRFAYKISPFKKKVDPLYAGALEDIKELMEMKNMVNLSIK